MLASVTILLMLEGVLLQRMRIGRRLSLTQRHSPLSRPRPLAALQVSLRTSVVLISVYMCVCRWQNCFYLRNFIAVVVTSQSFYFFARDD